MSTLPVAARISLHNVLVPTDFSEVSRAALPYAAELAKWYGAKLIVTHVVPPEPYLGVTMEPIPVQMDVLWNAARRHLDEFLTEEDIKEIPHEQILRRGEIWNTISGIVQRQSVDLIVTGTHGRQGLRKVVMGSVAEQIYRQAICPVLTIGPEARHRKAHWEPLRILFATDFSDTSLHALPYVLGMADERQGTLIMMHAAPLTPVQYHEAMKASICKKLEDLVAGEVWCKFEFLVDFNFPVESIIAGAQKHQADLIILGVNKRGTASLSTHLPWSTASQVVARAPCPVLTVRG